MIQETKIIVCGDLCPTTDNLNLFENSNEKELFNDILPILQNGDLTFGNCEFVLTENPEGIEKTGPILTGKPQFAKVLKNSGFNVLSLANNHIKDCGEAGVKSTMDVLEKNDIPHFGAGKNLSEAKKPFIKEINGLKIGFITFAEQEFNVAGENSYGANYFDPYEDLALITETKKKVDFLFVIYHGGIEYYEYPSPLLQKKCRKFVEYGADLVTCQHCHCIGTIEKYKDSSIVYGQGNTLFGHRKNNNSWNQGIILEIEIDTQKQHTINYIFIESNMDGSIQLMSNEKSKILEKTLSQREIEIQKDGFIQSEWTKFCLKQKSSYFSYLFGFSRVLTYVNRKFKNILISLFYNKKRISITHNIIRCEAHNEVVSTILGESNK